MEFIKIKPIAVIVISSLLMGVFGSLLNGYAADSGTGVMTLAIVGVAALALGVFKALIIQDQKLLGFGAALDAAAIVLLGGFGGTMLVVTFAVTASILFWAARRGEGIARQQLKIDIGSFVRAAAPLAITALALVMSVVYATRVIDPEFKISKSTVQSALVPAEPILRGFIPGFSLTSTVGDLVSQGLSGTMAQFSGGFGGGMGGGFGAMAGISAQSQVVQALSQTLGVRVGMGDTALDVLYRAANAQLAKIPEGAKPYVRAALGGLVFLTVRGFGFIFVYAAQLLVWLLFSISKSTGFLSVTIESVNKETVSV